jgi:hypothetical protein
VNTEMYIWCLEPQNNLKPRNAHLVSRTLEQVKYINVHLVSKAHEQVKYRNVHLVSRTTEQVKYINVYLVYSRALNNRCTFFF